MKSGNTLCQLISELIRRPKKRALVALLAILALTGTASALTINLSYPADSVFINAGLTLADIVAMKAANTYAALQFTSNLTDNINVNIFVTAVPGRVTLGKSTTFLYSPPSSAFTSIRDATATDATTWDDMAATHPGGSLPSTLTDPVPGNTHNWWMSKAQAKALVLLPNDTTLDGTFTFGGGFPYTYDPTLRAVTGKFDFIGVAMHEFSEIMGRIPGLGVGIGGNPAYLQYDLFRYTGTGGRGLTNGNGIQFSIDAGTHLLKPTTSRYSQATRRTGPVTPTTPLTPSVVPAWRTT